MPLLDYNQIEGYTKFRCDNCNNIVPFSNVDMWGNCKNCQAKNPVNWSKDHWSLLAYIVTRCVDYKGVLDDNI